MAGEAPPHVGLGGYSGGGHSSGGSGINEYVDEALLARVGELIARGGDGSGTRQSNEGLNIDSDILSRVSGSLGDSGSSNGPSPAYGVPSQSGPAMLGNPEPAERIAEFDLTEAAPQPQQQFEQGGYSQGPASFGGPSRGASSGGAISLGRPEAAQRVADFSLSGSAAGQRQSFSNGGYN